MKHVTTDPPFDCIAFKRKVQSEIYEQIKSMSPTEEIEYFRRAAEIGPFSELIQGINKRQNQPAGSVPQQREIIA